MLTATQASAPNGCCSNRRRKLKKRPMLLTIAVLLPAITLAAGKNKQQPVQDGVDRLNAPTADGNPTLKVTSDWLATTIKKYDGIFLPPDGQGAFHLENVFIDNGCTFQATNSSYYDGVGGGIVYFSIPLGAVDEVLQVPTGGVTGW
jgi:hypothetical protein